MALKNISLLTNQATASNDDIFIHQKKFINDPRLYAIKKRDIVNPVVTIVRYSKQAPDSVITAIKPLGLGTARNPYKISCMANLQWLSATSAAWSKYYLQTHDIDASYVSNFSQIGDTTIQFTGNYNGNGKKISNLVIYNPSTSCQAFIGYASNNSIICNLSIIDCNITGSLHVGSIVGALQTNSKVYNCFSSGKIYSNAANVGGLVGSVYISKVYNCYTTCNVYNSSTYASNGSLIGIVQNSSVVSKCYSTGNVFENNILKTTNGAIEANNGAVIINTYYVNDYCTSSITTGISSKKLMNIPLQSLGFDTSVWKQNALSYPTLRVFSQPSRYAKKVKILSNNSTTMAYPTKGFTVALTIHSMTYSTSSIVDNLSHNTPITALDGKVYNYPLPTLLFRPLTSDNIITLTHVVSGVTTIAVANMIPNGVFILSISITKNSGTNCVVNVYRNNSLGLKIATGYVDGQSSIQMLKKYFVNGLTKLYFTYDATGNFTVNIKYTAIPLIVQLSNSNSVYGLMYYDNGTDYIYQRTGTLSLQPSLIEGQTIITNPLPLHLLTVHNKMRRCITNDNGDVVYYLDKNNSMYRLNGGDLATGSINGAIVLNYSNGGTISFTCSISPTNAIGSYIKVYPSGNLTLASSHYALITGVSGAIVTLSHPHYNSWGFGCNRFRIGDAKLDGSHGQVMVLIPEFYWKYSLFTQGGKSWVHRLISLLLFLGSTMILKRYVSAFEGVAGDASGVPANGWKGTWDNTGKIWTSVSNTSTFNKLLSVAGYYPQTTRTRSDFRTQSNAVGTSYHQYDFMTNFVLQLLLLIEEGGYGSQERLSRGIVDVGGNWSSYNGQKAIRKTGDTVRYGNVSNTLFGLSFTMPIVTNYTLQSFSYRGVENMWGHIWKWVDSVNLKHFAEGEAIYAKAYLSSDPCAHVDDSLTNMYELPGKIYTHANSSSTYRYLKNLSKEFLPTDTVSSSSDKYIKDVFYISSYTGLANAWRVLMVGGGASDMSNAGAWLWLSYLTSGDVFASIGGRLCCKNKGI